MLASKQVARAGGFRSQANLSRPQLARPQCSRRGAVRVEAIGNFFGSLFKGAQPGLNQAKRKELVGSLLELATEKQPDEEAISGLVDELKPFGVKRPVRSSSLFGEYRVVFSTNSTKAQLTLEQPDQAREVFEVKQFGFLSGIATVSGEINDLDDNSFELVFTKEEVKGGLGGSKKVDLQRKVVVVYLDSDIFVTQQQKAGAANEDVIIYSKVKGGEDDEEDATPSAAPKRTGTGTFFFGGGGAPKEGTATVAERSVKRKMAEEDARGGSARVRPGAASSKAGAPATAREQLDQLAAELKERQEAAKEATKEIKEAERRNAAVLRSAAAAEAEVAAAEKQVQTAQAQVQEAGQGRKLAEQSLRKVQVEVASTKGKK